MCETVCDACELVLMYVVNVNMDVSGSCTCCDAYCLSLSLYIYMNLYELCEIWELQGRFCPIFHFFELKLEYIFCIEISSLTKLWGLHRSFNMTKYVTLL